MAIYYVLPFSSDADRTLRLNLGNQVLHFHTYYVNGKEPQWFLDCYDSNLYPLAVGRKLIDGSINLFKGFANILSTVAATCGVEPLSAPYTDALGKSLQVLWTTDRNDLLFKDGEPMDYLYENFFILQE